MKLAVGMAMVLEFSMLWAHKRQCLLRTCLLYDIDCLYFMRHHHSVGGLTSVEHLLLHGFGHLPGLNR